MLHNIEVQIKKHALENQNIECCGLLLSNDIVFRCENISEIKNHFQISPTDYLKATTLGNIIAVYHSHCNGNCDFSEYDKLMANNLNLKYILYCINTDKFKEYTPQTYKNPYIGRYFEIGKSDCFSLVREYYKKELNLDIVDCKRDINWYKTNEQKDLFDEIYSIHKNEWIKISVGSPEIEIMKKHDAVVMRFKEDASPCHIAIYVDDGAILHHKQQQYSTIEKYSKPYQRRTAYVTRHKSLI